MKEVPDCCKSHDFTDADEFLSFIRPQADHWRSNDTWPFDSDWVFRGHASAAWQLLPSAKRNPGRGQIEVVARRRLATRGIDWESIQPGHLPGGYAVGEYECVLDFLRLADHVGLETPAHSASEGNTLFSKPTAMNELILANSGFGLAQHHGVPTRLLDWTTHPFMAAYFAASDALLLHEKGNVEPDDSIAVWCLNTTLLTKRLPPPQQHGLRRVDYPGRASTFLRAQRGVFVFDTEDHLSFDRETREWKPFDAILGESYDASTILLHRVTLPLEQCTRLLAMLWTQQIARPYLRPTYDNVASALRWRWNLVREGGDEVTGLFGSGKPAPPESV